MRFIYDDCVDSKQLLENNGNVGTLGLPWMGGAAPSPPVQSDQMSILHCILFITDYQFRAPCIIKASGKYE
jgi:hypothetical protein